MATIFYYSDSGDIYGVHPSGQPVKVVVPSGVLSIEVPGPPDKIPWPSPGDGLPGREAWSRVDQATRTLVAKTEIVTEERDRRAREFDEAQVLKAAVLTILDEIDARHPANLVDRAAFRQNVLDRYRAL